MKTTFIPDSHADLIDGPFTAALTTLTPDGRPHTTPVWCNRDGEDVLINTMRGFRKERNMRANPAVTLIAYDPANPQRHVEIRGMVVEVSEDDAEAHLDALTRLYLRRDDAHFFGDCVPLDRKGGHHPVRFRIAPHRVRTEG
jgi:PPOX class probable F420-dependent enzyme